MPEVRSDRLILLDLVANSGEILAVGERGIVLRSLDDGKHWLASSTPTTRTLTGIAFQDPRHGVIVGHGGTILRTVDGGATWHPADIDLGTDSVLGVIHLGDGRYVAWGAFGLYAESADGGATWRRRAILGADFDRHISQIVRIGPTGLLLVGESGSLARSDDDGTHWTALTSPYDGSFFGALAVEDGNWLIFGMRGSLYRSVDQGGSWRKIDLDTKLALMSGRQLPDGRILLVGNAGLMALSRDHGSSFTLGTSARGLGFAQTAVTARGTVIAVGEGGVLSLTLAP